MQYVVNSQIAVEAESVKEALEKADPKDGTVISASIVPRPPTPTQGIQTSGQFQRTTTVQAPKLNG